MSTYIIAIGQIHKKTDMEKFRKRINPLTYFSSLVILLSYFMDQTVLERRSLEYRP